jgi:leucyl-tRNA---protein transferase
MTGFPSLKFYATAPHPCSYLEGQEATTLFVAPDLPITPEHTVKLAESGFRRSGRYIYRPHCNACTACISVRVPVAGFRPKRRHQRTLNKNQDIELTRRTPILDEEHYALYRRYIESRHADGDMYPPSSSQYASFLTTGSDEARFLDARIDGQLIATMLFDQIGTHGLSAIYTFFDPDPALDTRSLGSLMILKLIQLAQDSGVPYVYLGYWIRDCQKMAYKTEYRPIEMLINSRWIRAD